MKPTISDEKWETYKREFIAWLDTEIEAAEFKLNDLLKIKEQLRRNDEQGKGGT